MPSPDHEPLISLRTAVVLLAALLIGAIATALAYYGTQSPANAALVGGSAVGGATLLLHNIIGN